MSETKPSADDRGSTMEFFTREAIAKELDAEAERMVKSSPWYASGLKLAASWLRKGGSGDE